MNLIFSVNFHILEKSAGHYSILSYFNSHTKNTKKKARQKENLLKVKTYVVYWLKRKTEAF